MRVCVAVCVCVCTRACVKHKYFFEFPPGITCIEIGIFRYIPAKIIDPGNLRCTTTVVLYLYFEVERGLELLCRINQQRKVISLDRHHKNTKRHGNRDLNRLR